MHETYSYNGDDYRKSNTGAYRFNLVGRWFKEPLIVLQSEQLIEKYDYLSGSYRKAWQTVTKSWKNVTLGDLSRMSLDDLVKPREAGDFPICFQPRSTLMGWQLVLMVCDGTYESNNWRPARLQDLTLKDGKITGGLGLVRR